MKNHQRVNKEHTTGIYISPLGGEVCFQREQRLANVRKQGEGYRNKRRVLSLLIITTIFSILVFTGIETLALETQTKSSIAQEQTAPIKIVNETAKEAPKTIPEKNAYELAHMQQSGFKYAFFKFFAAMGGVLLSALAIFFGLKIYKKFILKNNLKMENIDYDKTLESPKDFKEAINLFLDKTDK